MIGVCPLLACFLYQRTILIKILASPLAITNLKNNPTLSHEVSKIILCKKESIPFEREKNEKHLNIIAI